MNTVENLHSHNDADRAIAVLNDAWAYYEYEPKPVAASLEEAEDQFLIDYYDAA